jgi:hypothetical protein
MSVDKYEGVRPGHLKFAFGDSKLLRSKHMLRQQCINTACRENLCNVYVETQGVRLGYKFAFLVMSNLSDRYICFHSNISRVLEEKSLQCLHVET